MSESNVDEMEFIKLVDKPIQDIITNEVSWHSLIYELVKSEQLDPWNIDIVLLTQGLLNVIKKMEEANLFISSKLFLVSSILIRMKSEILRKSLMSEEKKNEAKSITLDEDLDNLPLLIPKTPLVRQKKVTLQELMRALDKAVKTEERRIKKRRMLERRESQILGIIPKIKINIRERINEVYRKIKKMFSPSRKLVFDDLAGNNKEEKILTFIPLLHLDYQKKIELIQQKAFGSIEIKLFK